MKKCNRYNVYSNYLKKKYGEKVYKLPINIPVSCPNRDGFLSEGGCLFCGNEGAGFENLSSSISVSKQLKKNINYIGNKYNAKKFIAYFQNYTNTYLPFDVFRRYIKEACIKDIVGINISTRPDCINDKYLDFLSKISIKHNVDIVLELGLQTVNYHSLLKVNRGHTLAEFIDAVFNIQRFNLNTCAHVILNLPWDDMEDVIENAKVLSSLRVNEVKVHSLYIVKNTVMAEKYRKGEFRLTTMNEYINRVITFLQYLSKDIVIQRLIGRAPEERTIFSNWETSWWKIRDMIDDEMESKDVYQGQKADYLNGKCVDK